MRKLRTIIFKDDKMKGLEFSAKIPTGYKLDDIKRLEKIYKNKLGSSVKIKQIETNQTIFEKGNEKGKIIFNE